MKYLGLIFLFGLVSCAPEQSEKIEQQQRRIISLVPSVTELLYHYGLEDEVVAVTEHCILPKDLAVQPAIFKGMNPSIESLLVQQPSDVFYIHQKVYFADKLKQVGVKSHKVEATSFDQAMQSFRQVGALVNKEKEAEVLVQECEASLARLKAMDLPRQERILLSVSSLQSEIQDRPWVAGKGSLYDDLLNKFGVKNVYQDEKSYIKLSSEALIKANPSAVFILRPKPFDVAEQAKEKLAWQAKWPQLDAVKNGKIYFLGGDFILLAGPRIPLIIAEFEKALMSLKKEN